MKRNAIRSIIIVFLLVAFTFRISSTVSALTGENRPAAQSSLPQITFLGQGPQTFTVEPPLKFLVKTYQGGQFLFVTDDGPTYEAAPAERVWTTNFVPDEPLRLFDEERNYGDVEAGCVVNYVQIEDNLDTRRNTFFINGEVLQVVEQGMVTYGTFTVPEDGELTFFAEDSIGMIIELCQTVQTVVPGTSPTATLTETPTEEAATATPTTAQTGTDEPGTNTPTAAQTATALTSTATTVATATATATVVGTSTATPTGTLPTPGEFILTPSVTPATVTVTGTAPAATAVPTSTPATILITATPIATPSAIPVTGGVPDPQSIAAISATLIGLFGLVAAGWWFLLRVIRNGR